MENFTNIDYIILCILFGYGVVAGIENTFQRFVYLFTCGTWQQTLTGLLFDTGFYAGILYMILTYCGIA